MNLILIVIISLYEFAFVRANFVESLDINSHYANGIIRQLHKPVGKSIRLRCHIPEEHENSKIFWKFKKCGDYHGIVCETNLNAAPILQENLPSDNEEDLNDTLIWRPIQCKQPCKRLSINHLTEENSGLYQCYLQSNEENHVLRVYQLVVTDIPQSDFPEIIEDFPDYVISHLHEKVVLRCKAKSKESAAILWLKQTDNNSDTTIHNNNIVYEALQSSGEMMLNNNVYVSKLVIPNSTLEHKGIYECVAVNNIGYTHRSIFLNIIDKPVESFSKNDIKIYCLFIIPITFLFLPLMIWLCYFYYKKSVRAEELHGTGNIAENDQLAKNLIISVNSTAVKGDMKNYNPLIV